MLRSIAAYLVYIIIMSTTSFIFYWLIKLWIYMGRFTAADAPPGDISDLEKLIYSYGVPLAYGAIMTVLSFLYRRFLMRYSINLHVLFILASNLSIVIYFILKFRVFAFS